VPRRKRTPLFVDEIPLAEQSSSGSSTSSTPASVDSLSCLAQRSHADAVASGSSEPSVIPDIQQFHKLQDFIQSSSDVFCLQKRLHNQQLASMQDVQKAWMALALQDSAFFHAALSHYIGVDELDSRHGDPASALEHRMKALSVVQERLQSPQVATCDATIAAVASICAYESSNGSLDNVKAHWRGLENLVNMRGGFWKAGFHDPLERLVAWTDISAAFAVRSNPVIVPFNNSTILKTAPKFDFESYRDNIDEVLVMLRTQSRQLTNDPRTEAQHGVYNQGVYSSQRSLLHLLNIEPPKNFCLDHLKGLAAAIYVFGCLRNIGSHSRVVQCLVARLIRATDLKRSTAALNFVSKARLFVWALFCGGIAAIQADDRKYFAMQLAPICTRLKFRSWDDMAKILHSIAWTDSWGAPHQQFWQEIKECQN
jgi:hypothetical protein